MDVYFERPLLYPPEGSRPDWELVADWRVVCGDKVYTIPAGFATDGASIPRFLWRVCGTPLEAPRLYAAIVHDYLYSGAVPGVTRAEADAIYRDMLIALGVSRFKAAVEYYALRAFGWTHYNTKGDTKNEE